MIYQFYWYFLPYRCSISKGNAKSIRNRS